jgi:hypothetical protein
MKSIIGRYAELEMEIHRLVSARLGHVCKGCKKPCCRPEICREVVESWWLRNVSEHAHGRWWPEDWETAQRCIAIGSGGCILKAGRTGLCRSFVCDKYTQAYGDVWEAVFYSFAADLLMDVGALASGKSIEAMGEKAILAKADRIAERIERAHGLLAEAMALIDPAVGQAAKGRVALKVLAAVPRCLRATTQRAILGRVRL